jgi:hypothetical protein
MSITQDRTFETDASQARCRICYGENDTPEELLESGVLISPCDCRGTQEYVHLNCLNRWRQIGESMDTFWRCDLCKRAYDFHDGPFVAFFNSRASALLVIMLFYFLLAWLSEGHCRHPLESYIYICKISTLVMRPPRMLGQALDDIALILDPLGLMSIAMAVLCVLLVLSYNVLFDVVSLSKCSNITAFADFVFTNLVAYTLLRTLNKFLLQGAVVRSRT